MQQATPKKILAAAIVARKRPLQCMRCNGKELP